MSRGDVNKNGLTDAYDISTVSNQLKGGISSDPIGKVAGDLTMIPSESNYKAGEAIEIKVEGNKLQSVKAFSFMLPVKWNILECAGVTTVATKEMDNMTYYRLHSDSNRVLYPTFINVGDQPALESDGTILVLKFKAKRAFKFDLEIKNGIMVNKNLNSIKF